MEVATQLIGDTQIIDYDGLIDRDNQENTQILEPLEPVSEPTFVVDTQVLDYDSGNESSGTQVLSDCEDVVRSKEPERHSTVSDATTCDDEEKAEDTNDTANYAGKPAAGDQETTQVEENQFTQVEIQVDQNQFTQINQVETQVEEETQIQFLSTQVERNELTQVDYSTQFNQPTQVHSTQLNQSTQLVQGTEAEKYENQPTQLNQSTQLMQATDTQLIQPTQLNQCTYIEEQREEGAPAASENKIKPLSIASVRVKALRKSSLKLHEELQSKIALNPEKPLEISAEVILKWGNAQKGIETRSSPNRQERSVIGQNTNQSTASHSPLVNTPKLLTNFIPAVCSDNKKTAQSNDTVQKLTGKDSKAEGDGDFRRVRKVLFDGDPTAAVKPIDGASQNEVIIVGAVVLEDEMPRRELSYLNSQEPGEESQANALNAVGNLAWLNIGESQDGIENIQHSQGGLNEPIEALAVKKGPNLFANIAQVNQLKEKALEVFDFPEDEACPTPKKNFQAVKKPADTTTPQSKKKKKEKPAVEKFSPEKEYPTAVDGVNSTDGKPPKAASTKRLGKRAMPCDETPQNDTKRRRRASTGAAETHGASPATPAIASKRVLRSSKTQEKINQTPSESTPRRCKRGQIRVLFSHSLTKATIEQQEKIMKRLGMQSASKAADCTHFVTDKFLRTGNMLQVVAAGKPVVTVAWLESCRLTGCVVDVKNFILEDPKKEKELGFCMLSSLAASQHKLLLQGRKVYITPKTKPDILPDVIKAAGGEVVSEYEDDEEEECVVISCEEDKEKCVEMKEKGVKIYSAELLLSGVITYHLEFSKHQLFTS